MNRRSVRVPLRGAAAAALLAATLLGCATSQPDPALLHARQTVETVAQDPTVTRYAQTELARARAALQSAEQAQNDGLGAAEVAHRAYIAERLAAAAQATATAHQNDERVQQAPAERERLRLQARERAAQQAQQQAQNARQQAEAAQQQAQSAQQQADVAQQQAQAEAQHRAQLQQELEQLQAKQTSRGTVVTLSDVVFDSGKAILRPGSRRSIERLAGALKDNPARRVIVEGYTDNTGSQETNLELSQRRAQAVEQALTQAGVDDSRIEARGYGEEYPVADNDTAAGRQMNRRVEVIISDEQGRLGEPMTR